jgi:transaldolase
MKIFLDSGDLKEIHQALEWGMCDGVTTNPSIVAGTQQDFKVLIQSIAKLVRGPVSAEVISLDYTDMLKEAHVLAELDPNVVIKLPLTPVGLRVCKDLFLKGIKTNVTLCFQPLQALVAAKAGATYISPFIGRLDDVGTEGLDLIRDIKQIYGNYGFQTQILGASIRNPVHVLGCAKAGADVVTLPFKILSQMYQHPLTQKGIQTFVDDWEKSGQKSILS